MANRLPEDFSFPAPVTEGESQSRAEWREAKQREWLAAFPLRGWRGACESAGIAEDTPLRWLRLFPAFAEAHRAATADLAHRLESIADEIATGEREATPTQAAMLQFRLRALRPDLYRERASVTLAAQGGTEGSGGRARLLLAEWEG
jgi:hypothetical protein